MRNVAVADAVEDAIELYVLDTTLRRNILREDPQGTIQQGLSDFDEARTLRKGEELSHGHFRKWRREWEKHYREKLGKQIFWVPEMGGHDRLHQQWNAAFRQSQSFAVGDNAGATPAKVKFDGDTERFHRQDQRLQQKGALDRERRRLEAMNRDGMSANQTARIASLQAEAARYRTVGFAVNTKIAVPQCREHKKTGAFISEGPALQFSGRLRPEGRRERPVRLTPQATTSWSTTEGGGGGLVRLNALRACAAAGTEERRESLEGLEHLKFNPTEFARFHKAWCLWHPFVVA